MKIKNSINDDNNDSIHLSLKDYNKLISNEKKLKTLNLHYMSREDYEKSANTYYGSFTEYDLYSKQKIEKNADLEKHKREHGYYNGVDSKKKISLFKKITKIFQ